MLAPTHRAVPRQTPRTLVDATASRALDRARRRRRPRGRAHRSSSATAGGRLRALQKALGALPTEDAPRRRASAFNEAKNAPRAALARARKASSTRSGAARRAPASISRCPRASRGAARKHPGHARHRRDRGDLPRARLHRRARPRGRDRVVQLRRAELPGRSSGDGRCTTRCTSATTRCCARTRRRCRCARCSAIAPPIRILAPGNVYRRDFFDASHAPMFAQIEGLCVDEGISFVDLKATLDALRAALLRRDAHALSPELLPVHRAVGRDGRRVRLCGGAAARRARARAGSRSWAPAWCIPRVLEAAGVDSERYTGWAFGMGPGRIAMQRYDIPDIRLLYDSDVRFLEQIAR